nr:GNAT family N-acetyltransferase [Marivita sp. GX14005]
MPHVVFPTAERGGLIARIVAGECEILSIATDPDAQRQGVATGLLNRLVTMAAEQAADRIFLDVAARNHAARAFYDRHGFSRLGMRRSYYTLRDGSKDDALLLVRSLRPAAAQAPVT